MVPFLDREELKTATRPAEKRGNLHRGNPGRNPAEQIKRGFKESL